MHKIEFESCGRSMRWHEWLAGLLLLGLAAGVRAENVYKCVDAHGDVAYQASACTAPQAQSVIAIAPPPAHALSPHYVVEQPRAAPLTRTARATSRDRGSNETAFECRASDGRLFYRLGACPHSITADTTDVATKSRARNGGKSKSAGTTNVASRRIPREQACHEIHRAGAIGRDGHEFDEQVSTYERNLGRDPCKS
jgi:hypothetical protein